MSKVLVAYFSRKGNNYVAGNIIDLPVGNTEVVAMYIQEALGADVFHIESASAYSDDYHACTKEAAEEKRKNERPRLKVTCDHIQDYDIICLGFPNWWGTMPMPVFTFLESHDFSNKIIIPFCTHEGSGIGNSIQDIKKSCPTATVLDGKAIRGHDVKNVKLEVIKWIEGLIKNEKQK